MPIHNQLASGRGRGLNLTAADTVHSAADAERIAASSITIGTPRDKM
jgi:hypothetical protein